MADAMTSIERHEFAAEERQLSLIERRSKMLAASSIVPDVLRNKPNDVAAILLTADALGLPLTLATVSQFFVVNGKVVPSAQLMLGLVARRGLEFFWVRTGDTVAELAVRRPGADKVQLFQFTIQEAQKAGLTSKDVWKKFPTAMLMARATTRACRAVAPDILLGLPGVETSETYDEAPADVQAQIAQAQYAQGLANDPDPEVIPAEVLDATADGSEYPDRRSPNGNGDSAATGPETVAAERPQGPTPREPETGGERGATAAPATAPVEDYTQSPTPYSAAVHVLASQLHVSDEALDEILFEICGDVSAKAVTRENSQRVVARIREVAGVEAA